MIRSTYQIDQAHSIRIRDIDHNPNKPYNIVTAGDDCRVRFWDTRNVNVPLKEISDHSHW